MTSPQRHAHRHWLSYGWQNNCSLRVGTTAQSKYYCHRKSRCHCQYAWEDVRMWRSANLFDEQLGKWPNYPQNQHLSIIFHCQGVPERVFEQSQHCSPKSQCCLDLIIADNLVLLRWKYSVHLPWESLYKLRNNRPQYDQVSSTHVSNPAR